MLRLLSFARFAVAGGIGGNAVYHTCLMVSSKGAMPDFEIIAIVAGAGLFVSAAIGLKVN